MGEDGQDHLQQLGGQVGVLEVVAMLEQTAGHRPHQPDVGLLVPVTMGTKITSDI